jgi:hypothetical protein
MNEENDNTLLQLQDELNSFNAKNPYDDVNKLRDIQNRVEIVKYNVIINMVNQLKYLVYYVKPPSDSEA